jgi:hypothetical protein
MPMIGSNLRPDGEDSPAKVGALRNPLRRASGFEGWEVASLRTLSPTAGVLGLPEALNPGTLI